MTYAETKANYTQNRANDLAGLNLGVYFRGKNNKAICVASCLYYKDAQTIVDSVNLVGFEHYFIGEIGKTE